MVIADDDRIDGRYLEVHQGVLSLLALQAPVAGDLRLVAALLHVIKNIERMGDQCVNMAKLVPLAGHEPPADERILRHIQRMGEQARQQVVQCKQAFERRDVALAQDLVRQDDEIDRLNREVFTHRARDRRRPRPARVGDAHDAGRSLHRADRRQCRGHRRADRLRRHRSVPGVRGRLAPGARAAARLICACIDIGSNTTRLLVADAGDGQLRELVTQRAFTRIGKSLDAGGAIPAEKIAETAEVVATQAKVAREVGAEQIVAVATAAIRNAPNRDELLTAVERRGRHAAGGALGRGGGAALASSAPRARCWPRPTGRSR